MGAKHQMAVKSRQINLLPVKTIYIIERLLWITISFIPTF